MFSVEDLSREIADLAAHMDAATHRLLTCIRQFDEVGGWYEQGAASCAQWLAWRIGLDSATAREKVRVARALGKLPAIDEALRVGKLSYAKARALTRVAAPETEAKLLEVALVATGAQLERICRGYRRALAPDEALAPEERSVRRRDLPGGMVKLEIVLAPDEADLVLRALDRGREVVHGREQTDVSAETRKRNDVRQDVSAETSAPGSTWPSRADGMVALAENFLAGNPATGNGGERFQVMVHVDQDPLAPDGVLSASLDDGTRVSAETFRRIACDCGVVAVAGDGAGLNIGRRARSIPPAIRRALALRDRGCRFPGCTHTRFLHGHHIQHWLHGAKPAWTTWCSCAPSITTWSMRASGQSPVVKTANWHSPRRRAVHCRPSRRGRWCRACLSRSTNGQRTAGWTLGRTATCPSGMVRGRTTIGRWGRCCGRAERHRARFG